MENFIVSARKYRPANFLSVVGQNHITSTLRNAVSRGQLAHAYLFCGPRGVGKTTCARIFAKAINCMSPGEGAEACGQCESCRSFDEGRSFSIHELDAASNNSVDDIRNLTDQVRIPPQVGRYSVYIIDEVHMLSAQAFNAFLKTLEEPPAHAVFILATTEKHKIIPTILSRCQIFDFNRIKVEDGVGYMKHIAKVEGVTYDEESLNLIARKADGGMRDALSMFDKAVSFCGSDLRYKEVAKSLNILDYDTYFDAVETVLSGDYGRALLMFDAVLQRGFSGQTFMSGLNSHLRDLLVAANPQTAPLLDVTKPLLERYSRQATLCTPEFLFDGIALLTEIDARIRTATNQRLLVELALMKLCNMAASPGGEKKNSESLAPDTALPVLDRGRRAVQAPAATAERNEKPSPTASAVPAPAAGYVPQPAPATAAESEPVPEPAPPAPEAERASVAEIKSASEPVPAAGYASQPTPATVPETAPASQSVPAPTPTTAVRSGTSPAVSSFTGFGRSLTDIMNGTVEEEIKDEPEETTPVDPDAEAKIERFREKFVAKLVHERPRLGVVYETMETVGNTVRVKVASQTLRDEVLRYRTETLLLLAAVAGVYGPIELEVSVDETLKATRPIKIEDKVRYLAEKNPLFAELRRTLDMEIE